VRLAYVGNFSQPHCTESHVAATLEDMGHSVLRLQENEQVAGQLSTKLADSDLLLWTRTWPGYVSKSDLVGLNIPSASLHLDLYVGLQREAGLDYDPFWKTDFVFTPDGSPEAAEVFKRKGVNHHYLKPGVLKLECKPGNFRADFAQDVVFVGSGKYLHTEWPYRKKLLDWLRNTYGDRFGKYGHPEATIRNQDLNDLYASAKVVVGDSLCLNFTKPYYWSDRVYETIGRGGFIIHPFIEGMQEEFKHRETIVFYEYNDWTGLKTQVDHYLEHEDERKRIQQAGQDYVREHATYHNRLKQLLAKTDDLKINLGAGQDQFEGFVNTDRVRLPGIDVVHNLVEFPYPFPDACASEMRAVDVLEHLPNYVADGRPGVIAFIEECHRILKPGGELYIQTPGYDAEFLWLDPTHVRGFHPESMDFFDPDKHYGQTTGFYSEAKFSVKVEQLENKNLRFWMRKK
jgi:predicted SAM-dependent methyltransferase